jgi:L-amino acid N-acyltransferase YncA
MIIRDAVEADLPFIVEIYNATVPTRMVTAELEPTTVEARLPWLGGTLRRRHPHLVQASPDSGATHSGIEGVGK